MTGKETDERSTPDWLFAKLDEVFKFELDAAASCGNAKCGSYLTKEQDALSLSWRRPTGFNREFTRIFLNPPYSRGQLGVWLEKCAHEAYDGCRIVALVPVDTSTDWFAKVWGYASVVFFLKGRLKFNGIKSAAKFATAIAVIGDYPLPASRRMVAARMSEALTGFAVIP